MDKFWLYVKESYQELMTKVTWPTWSNLLSSGRLVVVATIMLALIIFLMDLVSKQALSVIYNL